MSRFHHIVGEHVLRWTTLAWFLEYQIHQGLVQLIDVKVGCSQRWDWRPGAGMESKSTLHLFLELQPFCIPHGLSLFRRCDVAIDYSHHTARPLVSFSLASGSQCRCAVLSSWFWSWKWLILWTGLNINVLSQLKLDLNYKDNWGPLGLYRLSPAVADLRIKDRRRPQRVLYYYIYGIKALMTIVPDGFGTDQILTRLALQFYAIQRLYGDIIVTDGIGVELSISKGRFISPPFFSSTCFDDYCAGWLRRGTNVYNVSVSCTILCGSWWVRWLRHR